jgi:DNA-binding IclR family transcriptional regulator
MSGLCKAVKLINLVDLVSRQQGVTLKEISEGLEVSRFTAYRLLNDLPKIGVNTVDHYHEGIKVWHKTS